MPVPTTDNRSEPGTFYAVGGSLRTDCPSYVERQADRELYDALNRHEFCYILTSRQMGKSSLMIRTVHRLRQEGTRAVVLDLTAIGSNLTAEQWYLGLLDRLGEQLGREEELEEYWEAHRAHGPLHRWMGALREVVLARLSAPLVIFIDEIDAVRSLPFSTDEFFAAIRECYNRRADEQIFRSLTFCLLGVAAPSDLIQDTQLTPFNIGRRIELTDFTPEEAGPLAAGLNVRDERNASAAPSTPNAQRLLARILYWTDGHPYLTQRLCAAVAATTRNPKSTIQNPKSEVDRLCSDLFLASRARERDDNLLFVRERLLRSEVDLVTLLDTYGRVRSGKRVADEESNGVVTALRLSGAVKEQDGWLRVRNRIYATVFDRVWVRENLPYAEVWRQQRAYRQGIVRTGFVSGMIVAVMAGLVWKTVTESRHVQGLLAQSEEEHGLQMLEDNTSLGLLYLLEAQRIAPDRAKPSQWAAWNGACAGRLAQIFSLRNERQSNSYSGDGMVFSDDGKQLVTWGQTPDSAGNIGPASDGRMQIWDVNTGRMHGPIIPVPGDIRNVVFSPDGKLLATMSAGYKASGYAKNTGASTIVQIRDVETGQPHGSPLSGMGINVQSIQFSRDSGRLLTADPSTVKLWDTATGRLLRTLWQGNNCGPAVLSQDGQSVAFTADYKLYLGRIDDVRFQTLVEGVEMFHLLAFSPDGKRLSAVWHLWDDSVRALHRTGSYDESHLQMRQWDAGSGHPVGPLRQKDALQVLTGREGDWFVTVSRNRTVQKWDMATGQPVGSRIQLPDDYGGRANEIVISADGARMADTTTGFPGQKTLVWDIASGQPIGLPLLHRNPVWSIRLSPDGSRLAVHNSNRDVVCLWDLVAGPPFRLAVKVDNQFTAFSPDGGCLAVDRYEKDVQFWDTRTGRRLGSPLPIIHEANGKFIADSSSGGILRRPIQFSADGRHLAVMTGDITVRLVDAATGLPQGLPLIHKGYIQTLAFRPDGKQLAVGMHDGTVQLWDTSTCQPSGAPLKSDFPVYALVYRPDGKRLVALSGEETRQIWDLDTRRPAATTDEETKDGAYSGITNTPFAAFDPDGKILATLSNKYGMPCIRLWAGDDSQHLQRTLTFQNGSAPWEQHVIGFSPNGRWLAAMQWGYRDHNGLMLWNTVDWKPTEISWPEPYQIVNTLFSPDGRWLAVTAEDSTEIQNGTGAGEWTVQLLNLDNGRLNTQILRQHGRFLAMAFLPDGNLQIAASNHDFVRLWRLPTKPVDYHEMELRTWLALDARLDPNKIIEPIPPVKWRGLQQELQVLELRQTLSSRR